MVKHSAIFNAYPEVLASGVEFHFNQDTTYYLNTEGTALRYPDDVAWIFARAEGQAPDGMVVRDTLSMPAFTLAKLPSEAETGRIAHGSGSQHYRLCCRRRWENPIIGSGIV